MNTQNTPIHMRLWHRDFWLVAVANLLLSTTVMMLIPMLPKWMLYTDGLTTEETGVAMAAFALGLFLPGAFCSYLIQRYRRNQVCVWAMLLLGLTVLPPLYVHHISYSVVVAMRIAQGFAFSLAQMVLMSTLIIDTCESNQRTEANHSVTWFGRFAFSLGPLVALFVNHMIGFQMVLLVAGGCCVVAAMLVLTVHIPFRTPDDNVSIISFDRFLLTSGWPLMITLMVISSSIGLLLSLPLTMEFYALLMVGFLLALLAQRFVFPDAELKSEVVTGLILLIAAQLIMLFAPSSPLCSPLLGLGLGLVGARFLLFFIKLSRHCQRGTAQSTYLLGWESGLSLGVGVGYYAFSNSHVDLLHVSLSLSVTAFLVYVFVLHNWFVAHKNR